MTAAGAELVDITGVWSFGGEPIRLKFIARPEDERRQIGDLIRPSWRRPASRSRCPTRTSRRRSCRSTPPTRRRSNGTCTPKAGAAAAPSATTSTTVNSMNAPWLGNMPGWREQGYWQYQNEELDTLGQQLLPRRVRQPRGTQRHLPQDDQHRPRRIRPRLAGQRRTPSRPPRALTDVTLDIVVRTAHPVHAPRGEHAGQGPS